MHNGPFLLQRIVEDVCMTKDAALFTRERCKGFEVHPRSAFYPIDGQSEWWKMYYENATEEVLKKVNYSYAIHTSNTITSKHKHKLNEPKSALSVLAKRFCPKLFEVTKHNML